MRRCPRCRQFTDDFAARYSSKCRPCYRDYMKERRAMLRARSPEEMTTPRKKKCLKCGLNKAADRFYVRRDRRHGLSETCRVCTKTYVRTSYRTKSKDPEWYNRRVLRTRLMRDFGITLKRYLTMLKRQGGRCRICRRKESYRIYGKVVLLSVDHCHATGKVRGLLCGHCNNGLGRFKDDPDVLERAAAYLRGDL